MFVLRIVIHKSQLGVIIWRRVSPQPGEQQHCVLWNEKWRMDFR